MSRSSSLIMSCTDNSCKFIFYVIVKNSGSQNTPPPPPPPPPPPAYSDFLLKNFKIYVDDIFVIFLWQSHLKDFANYMNTKHPNIKFASEFEENDSFSFLVVKITRSNNQLELHQFFVKQHLVVFLPTFMPAVYKFGLVNTLLHR